MKIVLLHSLNTKTCRVIEMHDKFKKAGHQFIYYPELPTSEDEMIERSQDADIVIVGYLELTENYINACKNLKYIVVAFSGTDKVDLKACKAAGIKVSNAPGYATESVSELSFGLLFELYKEIAKNHGAARNGAKSADLCHTLYGKTVGLIGSGRIGAQVAQVATAFGAKVLVYNRSKKALPNTKYAKMSDLLAKSDIVSLHLPLNEQTKGLIGEKELALMKSEAVLLNTARGAIVDSEALASALNSYKIAGAGIDVLEHEPPFATEHPLLKAKNTVITPHIAYATYYAMDKRWKIVMKNIRAFIANEPINLVN